MEVGSVNHILENWWWTNGEKLNSDQEKQQLVFSCYFLIIVIKYTWCVKFAVSDI